MGFVTPEFSWFTDHHDELEPQVSCAAERLAPVIEPKRLVAWYHSPQSKRPGDLKIWRVLCAAEWAQVFDVVI